MAALAKAALAQVHSVTDCMRKTKNPDCTCRHLAPETSLVHGFSQLSFWHHIDLHMTANKYPSCAFCDGPGVQRE